MQGPGQPAGAAEPCYCGSIDVSTISIVHKHDGCRRCPVVTADAPMRLLGRSPDINTRPVLCAAAGGSGLLESWRCTQVRHVALLMDTVRSPVDQCCRLYGLVYASILHSQVFLTKVSNGVAGGKGR